MSVRILLASFASATAVFFWGFIYWMILAMSLSPWKAFDPNANLNLAATIDDALPESGLAAQIREKEGGDRKQRAQRPIPTKVAASHESPL